jgi:hypothetical protein
MSKNIQISELKKAIEGSGGYISTISKRLNCDWHTAKRYIDLHNLSDLLVVESEKLNDLTEMKLIENIQNNDTTAIIFRLKTKGRDRGYNDRQEITNTNLNVEVQEVTEEMQNELLNTLKRMIE